MKREEYVEFNDFPKPITGTFLTNEQAEQFKNAFKDFVQVIRCKDCKYLIDHYGFMDDGYCENMREKHCLKFKPNAGWFCADGERRTNDGVS